MGVDKVQLQIEAITTQFNKEISEVRGKLRQTESDVSDLNTKMRGQFEKTGKVANQLSGVFATLFSIGAVVGFLKKMVEVRMEWEKQVSVLKTITGSQREAQATMMMLKKVSDNTAASLDDVTGAYVRLVNAGVKPTYDQLKKIGDLSIVTGKSFKQLAEAVYDASQKQIRGLRDVGIGAKLNGDKITLSFKGMTQTIDLTVEAMTEFITEAGGMAGVAGAAEELEKTVSGQFENIGEAWHTLMLSMGENTDGFVFWVTKRIQSVLNWLNLLTLTPEGFEDARIKVDELVKSFEGLTETEVGEELKKQQVLINAALTKIKADIKAYQEAPASSRTTVEYMTGLNALRQQKDSLMHQIELLREYWNTFGEVSVDTTELTEEQLKEQDNLKQYYWDKWERDLKDALKSNNNLQQWYWDQFERQLKEGAKLNEDYQDAEEEKTKKQIEEIRNRRDLEEDEVKKRLEILRKEKDAYQEAEDRKKENRIQAAIEVTQFLSMLNQSAMERELAAAGENEEQKEKIRRKYANREKAFAIMRAIISGAEAILKNTAQLGTIAAQPVNVWQGIITAIQVATIAAQKFATGIFDLQGRGTGTSDSIPAMLSRGESVMTAKETSEYYPYLKAMKEGTFPRFQMDMLEKLATVNNNLNYDNSKEIQVLRSIDKKLGLNKPEFIYVNGKKIIKYNSLSSHVN